MLYAIVAVIALIVDQAVKYWTTAHVVLNTGLKKLIPGFIHITNIHNSGAAFSFLKNASWSRWFFIALCAVFTVGVIVLLAKNVIRSKPARWTAVLVLSGALGNCIDRIMNGFVVDMFEFEFKIFGMNFPVFNVADVLITVCGVLFCIFFILEPSEKKQSALGSTVEAAAAAAPAVQRRGIVEFHELKERKATEADVPAAEFDPADPFAEWERILHGDRKESAPEAPSFPEGLDPETAAIQSFDISSDDLPAPDEGEAEAYPFFPEESGSGELFSADAIGDNAPFAVPELPDEEPQAERRGRRGFREGRQSRRAARKAAQEAELPIPKEEIPAPAAEEPELGEIVLEDIPAPAAKEAEVGKIDLEGIPAPAAKDPAVDEVVLEDLPAAPEAPALPKTAEEEEPVYDLESILAEFRDL